MSKVRIIIVSPMNAGNVGAIARLCGNFGVEDVYVVSPRCDIQSGEAKMLSTHHAERLLLAFKVSHQLREAVEGCDVVVGFSRRIGDMRRPDLGWTELSRFHSNESSVALVFGPEDVGLSQEDLTLCTHVCALQTQAMVPSMNLSQAVAVVLAGVYWQSGSVDQMHEIPPIKTRFDDEKPIAAQSMLSLVDHWRSVMVDVGLTRDGNPDRLLHYYHRLLNRARISEREGQMLRGFLSQIQIKIGSRKIKKGESDDVDG